MLEEAKIVETAKKEKEVVSDAQTQLNKELMKTKLKFITKQRRYYKLLRFFNILPIAHNCKLAIQLLGTQVRVDLRLYVKCPICNKGFPLNLGNEQSQHVSTIKNNTMPIKKKAAKRSKK